MSGFETKFGSELILGQEQPIRLLKTLFRNGTIPHAFLFLGIEGVGKKTTAMAFAMACNCSAQTPDVGPCGCCSPCRKIKSGNHPDIILIEPSGPFIRIDQIRSLCNTLALKPYEARYRVVIISQAQAMNPAAGNALLKMLEEPPDRTVLILTALQTSDLLPTIVSRCQHVRFNPIPQDQIEALLIEQYGTLHDDAKIISTLANGSVSKARSMIRQTHTANWIRRRIWLINEVESLSIRPIGSRLAFAAKLSERKEAVADSLEVMKSWFRDLIVFKYNPGRILNKDLSDKIQNASKKMTIASLLSKMDDIHSAQKDIQANSNLRLTLEVLTMRLAKT